MIAMKPVVTIPMTGATRTAMGSLVGSVPVIISGPNIAAAATAAHTVAAHHPALGEMLVSLRPRTAVAASTYAVATPA